MKYKQSIWGAFLISIVFILILGAILPKNPDKYLKDRFWALKVHNNPGANMLVLGDSRVYRGIAPKEMEKILPEFQVFNYAFSNGGLNPVIFNAANELLAESKEPKVIVLGVTAFSLNKLSKDNRLYTQEFSRPREEVLERMYFGKYLNYFSPVTPEKVRNLIKGIKPKVNYTNKYHDNGWVASNKFPSDTMNAMKYYKKDFKLHTTSYNLVNVLCNQIKTWEEQGIKVFAFRPPAAVPLIALEDSAGNYNEPLIKQKVQQAGGIWIDIDPTRYKTYDGSHLSEKEACLLSRKIAKEIKLNLFGTMDTN